VREVVCAEGSGPPSVSGFLQPSTTVAIGCSTGVDCTSALQQVTSYLPSCDYHVTIL